MLRFFFSSLAAWSPWFPHSGKSKCGFVEFSTRLDRIGRLNGERSVFVLRMMPESGAKHWGQHCRARWPDWLDGTHDQHDTGKTMNIVGCPSGGPFLPSECRTMVVLHTAEQVQLVCKLASMCIGVWA